MNIFYFLLFQPFKLFQLLIQAYKIINIQYLCLDYSILWKM